MRSPRGSVWANNSKKKGFSQSIGPYESKSKGDRFFVLTTIKQNTTKVYESPAAAERDGWFIVKRGQ